MNMVWRESRQLMCPAELSAPAFPISAGSVEISSCSGNPLISTHKELLQDWRVAIPVT